MGVSTDTNPLNLLSAWSYDVDSGCHWCATALSFSLSFSLSSLSPSLSSTSFSTHAERQLWAPKQAYFLYTWYCTVYRDFSRSTADTLADRKQRGPRFGALEVNRRRLCAAFSPLAPRDAFPGIYTCGEVLVVVVLSVVESASPSSTRCRASRDCTTVLVVDSRALMLYSSSSLPAQCILCLP